MADLQPPRSRSQVEADELIAELCIRCDDDELKTALKKYLYGHNTLDIEKKLKSGASSKVGALSKLLTFLNNTAITDEVAEKKDDIAQPIVCRIQNLLPDDCPFYNKRFKLEFDEKPFLPCAKCGQSSHKSCIIELIRSKVNYDISEAKITSDEVMNLLNPLSFPGIHYLCKACEISAIPTEINATSGIPEQEEENTNENEETPEVTTPEVTTSEPTSSISTQPKPVESASSSDTQNNTSTEKTPITCRFYKKGSCKYGIKGDECKYNHPELCKKYTQHGTRQPRGCNMGSKCKFFHPIMCIDSLRKGQCLSQNCRFRHIKGTTRHAIDGQAKVTQEKKDTVPHSTPQPEGTESSNHTTSGNFLDALRLLKAELLEEMDKRIKTVVAQTIVQQPTNNYAPQQQMYIKQPQQEANPQPIIPQLFYPQIPYSKIPNQTQQQQLISLPITQTQTQQQA